MITQPDVRDRQYTTDVVLGMLLGALYALAVIIGTALLYICVPIIGVLFWGLYALPWIIAALSVEPASFAYIILYIFGIWIGGPFVVGVLIGLIVNLRRGGPLPIAGNRQRYPTPQTTVRRRIIICADDASLPLHLRHLIQNGTPIILEEEVTPEHTRSW